MTTPSVQALINTARALLDASPVDEQQLYQTLRTLIDRHGYTKASLVRELGIGKQLIFRILAAYRIEFLPYHDMCGGQASVLEVLHGLPMELREQLREQFERTGRTHSQAQIEGWKAVTQAVHAKGGLIFLQLWHVGRTSHSSLLGGQRPVAPSAIAAPGNAFTAEFKRAPFETPRALETAESASVIQDYARAARNAREAGFDGVEIHAANGYLLEQFLQSRSNHRTDAYGGSIENRSRIVLEVAEAVSGGAAPTAWASDCRRSA